MKISWHLHLHLAFLDYISCFLVGISIILFPYFMCSTFFFPTMDIPISTVFTLQLFGLMLISFSLHFLYYLYSIPISSTRIHMILLILLFGDLLHLFVYYRGLQMNIFVCGISNPGVLPNIIISSYAALSRIVYLLLPTRFVITEDELYKLH